MAYACCVKRRVASAGPMSQHNSAFDIRTVRDRIEGDRVGEKRRGCCATYDLLRNETKGRRDATTSPGPVPLPPRGATRARSPPRSAVDDRRVEPRLGRPQGQGATPERHHIGRCYRLCLPLPPPPPAHRHRPRRQRGRHRTGRTDPGEPRTAPSETGVPKEGGRGRGGAPQDDGGPTGDPEGRGRRAPSGAWSQLSEEARDELARPLRVESGHTGSPGVDPSRRQPDHHELR